MCFQIIERCPFCHRVTHKHAIDPCPSYAKSDHLVQENTVYSSDDCSEHFNYGIQEAGDAVTFPSNSAVTSAIEASNQSQGLSVPKPCMSLGSESASMATPRAPQLDRTKATASASLKDTTVADLDKATEDTGANNAFSSEVPAVAPGHHGSDATQCSTDSEVSHFGSCSTAATSRSSSIQPLSRTESLGADFEMDKFEDQHVATGNNHLTRALSPVGHGFDVYEDVEPQPSAPARISSQRLVHLLLESASEMLLIDLRTSRQYLQSRIRGALNLCIPQALLQRPSFNVHRLSDTFLSDTEKNEFNRWKECKFIVAYGCNFPLDDTLMLSRRLFPKFEDGGWAGKAYVLRDCFSRFSDSFPAMLEPLAQTLKEKYENEENFSREATAVRLEQGNGAREAELSDSDQPNRPKSPVRLNATQRTHCVRCRKRKLRCNAQKPTCGPCERVNVQCVYSDGRGPNVLLKSDEERQKECVPAPISDIQKRLDSGRETLDKDFIKIKADFTKNTQASSQERGLILGEQKSKGESKSFELSDYGTLTVNQLAIHSQPQMASSRNAQDPEKGNQSSSNGSSTLERQRYNLLSVPKTVRNASCITSPQQSHAEPGTALEPQDTGYDSSTSVEFQQLSPEFQVVTDGHPTLECWAVVQPTIKEKYKDIMGWHNPGAIEFLAWMGVPTVCVTCKVPVRVNKRLLRSLVTPLPIHVGQGRIRRSGPSTSGSEIQMSDDDWDEDGWPSSYGQYAERPVCGASIGVSSNDAFARLDAHAVSLGGYIQMIPQGFHEWHWYGMTCHHLLEGDDDDDAAASECDSESCGNYANSLETSTKLITIEDTTHSSYSRWIPSARSNLRSPAKATVANLIFRVEQRINYQQNYSDYSDLDNTDLHSEISRLRASKMDFGRAEFSSGLCSDPKYNVQIDWLLIGDIPSARRGSNYVGSLINYKEGLGSSLALPNLESEQHVTEKQFGTLIISCRKWKEDHGNQCGLLSRIHGIGSETGAGEGRLAHYQVGIDIDGTGNPTFEWSFKPRGKLGVSGDSGTWIFTENGKLLGMIWGFNDRTGMVYYTPIHIVFDHMKRALQFQDIRVPQIEHFKPSDSGYGSAPSSSGILELSFRG